MGPRSRLVINESVYDGKEKTRQSFLSLSLGRVRFWVVKTLSFKRSEFKVRTKTSIGGVRGSDFVANVTPEGTEWSTLEDTLLEVRSTVDPGAKPMILEDFEQTVVKIDALPTEKWKITPEEILEIQKTLTISMIREERGLRPRRVRSAGAKPGDGATGQPDAVAATPPPPPRAPPGGPAPPAAPGSTPAPPAGCAPGRPGAA